MVEQIDNSRITLENSTVDSAIMETKIEEKSVKISFGVKRKEATRLIKTTTQITEVHDNSDDEKNLEEQARVAKKRRLEKFENGMAPKDEDEKEQKLVIPAIVGNDWRVAKLLEKQQSGVINDEERARLAILTEERPFDFQAQSSASAKHIITIGGDKITVAEDADYKNVPIEQFGLAILRGCGYKEDVGIGRKPQIISLQINAQRPKGLGLGAVIKKPHQKKLANKKEDDECSGEIEKDSLVKITSGRNSGKYGKVESRDDDINSVYLRLALGGQTLKVSFFALQKVSKKEYEREGKCLNKKSYDTAKAEIDRKRGDMEKATRRQERGNEDDDVLVVEPTEGPSTICSEELWVRPGLVVRYIDKNYARGKLYKEKLRVVDVASRKEISLEDDYGQIFYNLRQNDMETVIPRNEGERIMVVKGKYKGEPAIMEKKDKQRDKVTARLLNQGNKMIDLYFDYVSLYKPKYQEDEEDFDM